MMTASPEVVAAAQKYSERGYSIVAVRPDKKPWGDIGTGENWRRHFTTQEILDRLRGPHCVAIGFLGGALNDDIVPLDFDTDTGEAWWRAQCEAAGIDPDDFPIVITPGKVKDGVRKPGRHRYVRDVRQTLSNAEGKLTALGINVRGKGHAMLPPSPHPEGGRYKWLDRHGIEDFETVPPCPAFIYDAIKAQKQERTNGHHHPITADDRERRYAAAALASQCDRVAKAAAGGRNNALNIAAVSLGHQIAAGRIGRRQVEAALLDAADANGLLADDGERACLATIKSGLDKGEAEPAEPLKDDRSRAYASGAVVVPRSAQLESPNRPVFEKLADLGLGCASELMLEEFKPLKWAIPDLVPEGLTLLAGKPKTGKSWLALDFALAAAGGACALGTIPCEAGPVLYLALEDTKRRLQGRMRAVLQSTPAPDDMEFKTEWRLCDQGGLADIRTWMEAVSSRTPRLLIVDTLQKVRGTRKRDAGVYEDDYRVIADFKVLADEFQVPIMLVTHLNKAGNDDPIMAVSGTAGITGSADTILVLKREPNDPNAVLYVRGRDVNEAELAIQFDNQTGKWLKLGKANDFRISEERRAIIQALTLDAGSMTPKEIGFATQMKPNNVRYLLHKLAKDGDITRCTDGKYKL